MDKSCGLSFCGRGKSIVARQRIGLWRPTKEISCIGSSTCVLWFMLVTAVLMQEEGWCFYFFCAYFAVVNTAPMDCEAIGNGTPVQEALKVCSEGLPRAVGKTIWADGLFLSSNHEPGHGVPLLFLQNIGHIILILGSIMSSQKAVLGNASIFSRSNFRSLSATQPIGFNLISSTASIKYGVIYRSSKNGFIICATSKPVNTHAYADDSWPLKKRDTFQTVGDICNVFYRFSRPHTVIGTVIGIISVSLLAVQSLSDISPAFWIGLLQAVIPALFMNIYIVGLNQIYDIEIDKINKPYLPLASGEYSLRTGVAIVTAFAFMSLGFGVMIGSVPLLWALSVSLVLGTAYSTDLPFLRWKRSAVAAASCILCVRAIVVQLAFYLHMQSFVYRRPAILTKPLIFATAFMCFFSVVIALFKDIPDVDGDKIFGIQSFSVRLGQARVFWLCIYLLQAAYGVAITMGCVSSLMWSKLVMVLGHTILATILWRRAVSLDLKSKVAITSFYMFIWKLFYAEYLLIPFMR